MKPRVVVLLVVLTAAILALHVHPAAAQVPTIRVQYIVPVDQAC